MELSPELKAYGRVLDPTPFATLLIEQTTAKASLKAGAADQFEVASSELELRASELTLFDTQLKLQQAIAQLEDALQQPFDALRGLQDKAQARTNTP